MSNSRIVAITKRMKYKKLPRYTGQMHGKVYVLVERGVTKPRGSWGYLAELVDEEHIRYLALIAKGGKAYTVFEPIKTIPDEEPALGVYLDEHNEWNEEGIDGMVVLHGAGEDGKNLRVSRFIGPDQNNMVTEIPLEPEYAIAKYEIEEFVYVMYLRYFVFRGIGGDIEAEPNEYAFIPLEEPVEIFENFHSLPLPDAIDGALYRIRDKDVVSGLEEFAEHLLSHIDLERLRNINERAEIHVARIEHVHMFYLNYNHSELDEAEIYFLHGVETVLNRISRILTHIGCGLSPARESPSAYYCALHDLTDLRSIVGTAREIINQTEAPNPWMVPGSVRCQTGGAWDIMTRIADLCERLNIIYRLSYVYRYDADAQRIVLEFIPASSDAMPYEYMSKTDKRWTAYSDDERVIMAKEFTARMALIYAAACFSAGQRVKTVVVSTHPMAPENASLHFKFERTEFLAKTVQLTQVMAGSKLLDQQTNKLLDNHALQHDDPLMSELLELRPEGYMPRDDARALPQGLRDMLLADTAAELEVMEDPDDPYEKRVQELKDDETREPHETARELANIIEELQSRVAAEELLAETPVVVRYCQNYVARLLLGLHEENKQRRVLRLPDALFDAQLGLAQMYMGAGQFEEAIVEARKCLDMAPTSPSAHFGMILALSQLDRYEEIIEVARHGLSICSERDDASYLYYRLAFAYWNTGEHDLALACYREVIGLDPSLTQRAREEMEDLMREMGIHELPNNQEMRKTLERAQVPDGPTDEVCDFLADAAVQLVDAGFYFLGARCIYDLWRVNGHDVAGVMSRSLNWASA
ncbi:tetratricopeptide repeat protein [Collinsella sp. zg1085]|uniref:tetratricopeptide repeat protein n=1 Tax=Collinsella sp. zg1085 TaxID=2844380 RepID=UPI001C0D4AE3|nr:tetratricopeptide repeat protein [Collinsella sp. zg1085]QWT18078.1 tetratricopeptide repeat protein [Collinsella sp. zg1085]